MVTAISEEMVLPSQAPPAIGAELRVTLCPGEIESASFVVRSPTAAARVLPRVTDLQGSGGVLPAAAVDLKIVETWYQSTTAWRDWRQKEGDPVLIPELLVNDPEMVRVDHAAKENLLRLSGPVGSRYVRSRELADPKLRLTPTVTEFPIRDAESLLPVDLPAGAFQQFWVTVEAPSGIAPGLYRGEVRIEGQGGRVTPLPMVVEILPFELAPPDMTYSLYYRGKLDPDNATVSSEWKSERQLRAELVDMLRHGIGDPTMYQPWPKPTDGPSTRARKLRLVEQVLRLRQELGLAGRPLFFLGRLTGSGDQPRVLQRLGGDVREIRALANLFGAAPLFLYGTDEAKGERLTAQRAAWQRVRSEGAGIFAAGYSKHARPMGELTDVLILHGKPLAEEAAAQHAHGNRILSYSNPQSGPEDPVLYRRNYGIALWQAGFDGAMLYAYQDSRGSIWNDFDHETWRDLVLTYPTTAGPVGTLAFEGLREAVDDVRYLRTLEGHVLRAEAPSRAVEKAQDFLETLRRDEDFDPADARRRMIRHLRALQ